MSSPAVALRPLGIGDLLDETIRLYRRNFRTLTGIAALVLIPLGVLDLLKDMIPVTGGTTGSPLNTALNYSLLTGVLTVLGGLGFQARYLATISAVSEAYLGGRPTALSSYAHGMTRFRAAVGLSVLVFLALFGISITILGIPFAIYLGIAWAVSLQVLLLEGTGVRRALGRSRELVRGRWWRVLAINLLLGILQAVIQMAIAAPVSLALAALLGGDSSTGGVGWALYLVMVALFGTVAQMIAEPIWFCGGVLLYYDLRIRREGFDLELLAHRVSDTPQPGLPPA